MKTQMDAADSYSLRGRVFNSIRENILLGVYKQNDELRESTIGAELGVSRTPVREALRQLELEGLVTIVPNKGAYVTGISAKDIQDIYAIRSMLEGLCARWAAANASKEQIDELEEILCLSEFNIKKGNLEQIYELDNKFHEVLYQSSDSKILTHTLSDFHHYVERVRKITLSSMERAISCNEEHAAIVEAVKSQNCELAERLANEHIMNTMKNISDKGLDNILSR